MCPSRLFLRRAVTASVALGALSWGALAQAFCREVAATPPMNYDPTTSGCFTTSEDGGALPPLYWHNQCVGYSFQRQGSKQIALSDAARIAAASFSAWSYAACAGGGTPNIFADPEPVVDCDNPDSQGHNNVIIFRDNGWPYTDAANAIGYTTLTIRTGTGEILGADIEINSTNYNIVADAPPPDGGALTYDLGSILTHEAGHFLGLAHSADTSAVMFAHYHPGSTVLTPDDVSGICSIYSPDGTRNTAAGAVAAESCNPEPPLGFSTACGSLDAGTLVGSGALPEGGEDDGGDPPCTGEPNCSVGPWPTAGSGRGGSGSWLAGFGVCGLVVLGAAARRARRKARRTRETVGS